MDVLALGHAGTGRIRLSLLIHQLCGELGSVCESEPWRPWSAARLAELSQVWV